VWCELCNVFPEARAAKEIPPAPQRRARDGARRAGACNGIALRSQVLTRGAGDAGREGQDDNRELHFFFSG
jgi:hypothetical protein